MLLFFRVCVFFVECTMKIVKWLHSLSTYINFIETRMHLCGKEIHSFHGATKKREREKRNLFLSLFCRFTIYKWNKRFNGMSTDSVVYSFVSSDTFLWQIIFMIEFKFSNKANKSLFSNDIWNFLMWMLASVVNELNKPLYIVTENQRRKTR